ncbi:MAG: hypothetical protein ACKO3N_02950, partial [Verrucomicrobiota bacterium]
AGHCRAARCGRPSGRGAWMKALVLPVIAGLLLWWVAGRGDLGREAAVPVGAEDSVPAEGPGRPAAGGGGSAAGPMPPCEAPAPAGVQAVAGPGRVTLSWTAVPEATGYRVYGFQGGRYTLCATSTAAAYTDAGLAAGQEYCYAVTALRPCPGAVVESGHSTIVCATPTRDPGASGAVNLAPGESIRFPARSTAGVP